MIACISSFPNEIISNTQDLKIQVQDGQASSMNILHQLTHSSNLNVTSDTSLDNMIDTDSNQSSNEKQFLREEKLEGTIQFNEIEQDNKNYANESQFTHETASNTNINVNTNGKFIVNNQKQTTNQKLFYSLNTIKKQQERVLQNKLADTKELSKENQYTTNSTSSTNTSSIESSTSKSNENATSNNSNITKDYSQSPLNPFYSKCASGTNINIDSYMRSYANNECRI